MRFFCKCTPPNRSWLLVSPKSASRLRHIHDREQSTGVATCIGTCGPIDPTRRARRLSVNGSTILLHGQGPTDGEAQQRDFADRGPVGYTDILFMYI